MIIRIATSQDMSSILKLLYELGRPKPEDTDITSFGKIIIDYIIDKNKQILVAGDDTDIVGMISIMYLTRLNHITKEMYIPELIVNEKYQNRGIGTKLVNACIALGKEKKCHRIRLESGIKRVEAHLFYNDMIFDNTALSYSMNLKSGNEE